MDDRGFTPEELAGFDGEDGSRAYVAFEGVVYDATSSPLWKEGLHQGRHRAGRDLTSEIAAGPHGEEMLQRMPRVGVLVPSTADGEDGPALPAALETLLEKVPLLRREPHLVTVHFPVVFALLVPFFHLLFLMRRTEVLERTAYYLVTLGAFSTPLATGTGYLTWYLNYGARPAEAIKVKMACSAALSAVMFALFALRAADASVLDSPGCRRRAYLSMSLSMPLLAAVLGRYGGKLSGHV